MANISSSLICVDYGCKTTDIHFNLYPWSPGIGLAALSTVHPVQFPPRGQPDGGLTVFQVYNINSLHIYPYYIYLGIHLPHMSGLADVARL